MGSDAVYILGRCLTVALSGNTGLLRDCHHSGITRESLALILGSSRVSSCFADDRHQSKWMFVVGISSVCSRVGAQTLVLCQSHSSFIPLEQMERSGGMDGSPKRVLIQSTLTRDVHLLLIRKFLRHHFPHRPKEIFIVAVR